MRHFFGQKSYISPVTVCVLIKFLSNLVSELRSLDAELYKNLLFLKSYEGNVSDLSLSFSVQEVEFGVMNSIDLKPNGSSIDVSNSNRMEYIFLMADLFLNKRLRAQSDAFIKGIDTMFSSSLLLMFDVNELQDLLSGSNSSINVDDWMEHTRYDENFCNSSSRVCKWFWKAVQNFSEIQRSKLLRFVTSVGRPPLNGFKFLQPAFTIRVVPMQNEESLWSSILATCGISADNKGLLPTASTCFNLLKIPNYSTYDLLADKLALAIENDTGFGLS